MRRMTRFVCGATLAMAVAAPAARACPMCRDGAAVDSAATATQVPDAQADSAGLDFGTSIYAMLGVRRGRRRRHRSGDGQSGARVRQAFDADTAMALLRTATQPYTPAAMFQLADEGFTSVFQQLVSCVVSIRTLEETTLPCCRRLFAVAATPAAVAALTVEQVERLIAPSTFHPAKARQIHAIAARAVADFGGVLPCDFDVLTGFHGVGPKCANLAIGVACPEPHGIPVDIHVHRVANRWGIVAAATPEKTRVQLEAVLPRRYWVEINRMLVPFGKFVCTGQAPRCSACPLLAMCRQVGVTTHR